MKNDVKDWLPDDFPETKELEWFRDNFLGEQFVLVTWPGCTEDDERFKLMVDKLRADCVPLEERFGGKSSDEHANLTAQQKEDLRARKTGDRYGLFATGEYHEDWGNDGERWLTGDHDKWYYVTKDGGLYRWSGESNLLGTMWRGAERLVMGTNVIHGELVDTFGPPVNNPYYDNPRKLTARLFKTVTTGPDVLNQLAGANGTLRPQGVADNDPDARAARRKAYTRLSGVLFGPQPQPGFQWTKEDFRRLVPPHNLEQLPEDWEQTFDDFVKALIENKFDGDRAKLLAAHQDDQTKHWYELFDKLDVRPPARQTCLLVTLSDVGRADLKKVVGRPILGRPRGRILEIANDCNIVPDSPKQPSILVGFWDFLRGSNIEPDELKLGGPPVDNVAIDEEGTRTLVRLVSFSAAIGLSLAYLSFRSVKVTLMIFFVGGVSAATSLGIVWWWGSTMDAILMSMPSLVYVLGLSGAVHIVNYYRDAAEEHGAHGAAETAIRHGWFPCTLAAFTTALGMISLFTSNLVPIKKFGLFAALGTMATLILMFTYLPAALVTWSPGYRKREAHQQPTFINRLIGGLWQRVGGWVVRRHWWVSAACMLIIVVFALGVEKIQTSVQLLKLFDSHAEIISDYTWLEQHLGKLVPMELVVCVDPDTQRPTLDELEKIPPAERDIAHENLQYDFLERAEIAGRAQMFVEEAFGEGGSDIVGNGMSAATFIPDFPAPEGGFRSPRMGFNSVLENNRHELLKADYLRVDQNDQRELWRVSLRLGALNDVDYGTFVRDMRAAVEPMLSAYRYRNRLLRELTELHRSQDGSGRLVKASVLILGTDPKLYEGEGATILTGSVAKTDQAAVDRTAAIDQTAIFARTFDDLLRNKGFKRGSKYNLRMEWHDPRRTPFEAGFATSEQWAAYLKQFEFVLIARGDDAYDLDFVRQNAKLVVDARDLRYDPRSPDSLTAAERKVKGDQDATVTVVYTGIVPIVYKAQRTLLESLVQSIALAFVMITAVMMLLLRDWKSRLSLRNSINFSGGLVSMLPNVFPVVLIFGAMGFLGVLVDIGSMMTASVALGVAVDDTIHFLSWFRLGLRDGLTRRQAIAQAYDRCATAMTQTTAIGGLGLAVFALSTFTPTQQFGILMLLLLVAALIGDLIFLPALLAGPLGYFFEPKLPPAATNGVLAAAQLNEPASSRGPTPHGPIASQPEKSRALRRDDSHEAR